ncbi:unnamed protein product [Chironomus riparius]|uniref:Uncharacterized protein n=1 Tax=Chironomus riparius TaxID=315576 RepID=A0A9N9RRX5_9DIPT|nr:unnamed protein product [Chironomus riparius]
MLLKKLDFSRIFHRGVQGVQYHVGCISACSNFCQYITFRFTSVLRSKTLVLG